MRSIRREIGRYPGRSVVLLGVVYLVFFMMHGKMMSLPEARGELHQVMGHDNEEKVIPVVVVGTPSPTDVKKVGKTKTKTKTKVEVDIHSMTYSIRHYGHGIYHVMGGEEKCKYQEDVLAPGLVPTEVEKVGGGVFGEDHVLKFRRGEAGTAEFDIGGSMTVTVDPTSKKTHVKMAAEKMTGLPERTSGLVLTDGTYELWNLDVFKYKLNDKAPLYGVVPILVGLSEIASTGFLWLNPSHSTVTVTGGNTSTWSAAENCMQFLMYPGATVVDVLRQHSHATGKPFFPPKFSIGYHQCRWNYKDEADVDFVNENFKSNKMPVDAIWLDIEHTEKKHYFTWDKRLFKNPIAMQSRLKADGRKLVTITDPHISRSPGYFVHEEAKSKGFYVKDQGGSGDYHGHCWPGDSSWVDFLNPMAREWYSGLFQLDTYQGSTEDLHSWIDMNEPSVFSGPRTTMHNDATHYDGAHHVAVHNIYGHLHAMATHEGLMKRSGGEKRGFVLTRSFFAGTQRYAAVWTGDNMAAWPHLKGSVEMLLGLGMGGIPFVGADVGGFFGNSDPELMLRWFQIGVFYPFYRGHSHHENRRKEPYTVPTPHRAHIASALHLRYTLLPYIYTCFWNASSEGLPILRPVFLEFPKEGFQTESFMIGGALLAAPVTRQGEVEKTVPMPKVTDNTWYAYEDGRRVDGETDVVKVGLGSIPLYQRGGTVVVAKEKDEEVKSTVDLERVGYQLRVAVNPTTQQAEGKIYLDDGETTSYQTGHYNFKNILFSERNLTISCAHSQPYSPLTTMPPHDVPYTPPAAPVTSILFYGLDPPPHPRHNPTELTEKSYLIKVDLAVTGGWTLQL